MPRFTIHDLAATIDARAASGGEASYARKLLDKGSEHCAKKLAGAIAGRALYDGRLNPTAALALIRNARAAA